METDFLFSYRRFDILVTNMATHIIIANHITTLINKMNRVKFNQIIYKAFQIKL